MSYHSPTTNKLFAFSGSEAYDVTSSGAIAATWDTASWDTASWASTSDLPVLTSLSNARWEFVNFTTSGGSFLFICNGVDAPRHYNGTTWATPTLSGITSTTINIINTNNTKLMCNISNIWCY